MLKGDEGGILFLVCTCETIFDIILAKALDIFDMTFTNLKIRRE